ncbi:hypothetical protein O9993_05220 [Vibrio lentus]|nr:hypothetical protein [Vibrio lentus]
MAAIWEGSLLNSLPGQIKGRRDSKAEATRVYKKLHQYWSYFLIKAIVFDSLEIKDIVKSVGRLASIRKEAKGFLLRHYLEMNSHYVSYVILHLPKGKRCGINIFLDKH